MDVFSNIEILDGKETKVDTYLCLLTALHAVAAKVWDYRQQSAFAHNVYSTSDEIISLLSDAFQNHTYVISFLIFLFYTHEISIVTGLLLNSARNATPSDRVHPK